MAKTVKLNGHSYTEFGGVVFEDMPTKAVKKLDKLFNIEAQPIKTAADFVNENPERAYYRTSKSGNAVVDITRTDGTTVTYPVNRLNHFTNVY